MFSSISNSISRISTKRLVIAAGFAVAIIAAAGFGLATKQYSSAATKCTDNDILYCGAASPSEFIKDVRTFNASARKQTDLQNIYASQYGGLSASEYSRFEKTARPGIVYKDGRVVVDNQVVMTGALSMGRQSFGNPNRKPVKINSKTYYASVMDVSFAKGVTSLPVMVMFDAKGAPQSIVMNACGNPVWGKKVTPEYACKALNSTPVAGETDAYDFSTSVSYKNASVNKVVYDFGDGTTHTETNPAKVVRHKYAKAGDYNAKVTVYFNLPGKQVVAAPIVNCAKKVTVVKPYFACTSLTPATLNDKKTQFRFTVIAKYGNGATLQSADFTLDGKNTTTGVTTKDANGNIYKDYTVAEDGAKHTVVAKVNFNVEGKVTSVTCQASIEAGVKPYFACTSLTPTTLNDKKTQFRFTVTAHYGNGATLKSADFTLDDKNTTTGVTTKDAKGNIYKDYTVAEDGAKHTVVAKVNFDLEGKVTSVTCQASIEAGKVPECKPGIPVGSPECEEKKEYCETPGKEHLKLPKDSPDCEEYKCPVEGKEDLPKEECVETPHELPKTGMGNVFGLFAGTSAFGAVAHRVIANRRRS